MLKERLLQYKLAYDYWQKTKPVSKTKKVIDLAGFLLNRLLVPLKGGAYQDYGHQFSELMKNMPDLALTNGYFYPFTDQTIRCLDSAVLPIASVTPDYTRILRNSLETIRKEIESYAGGEFADSLLQTIKAIVLLIEKVAEKFEKGDERSVEISECLRRILDSECEHFDEAIQRILFFNALLWQNGHQQNGVGRIDLILEPYYKKDIEVGVLSREKAKDLLHNMVRVLGKEMLIKSASIPGDTGQIIILGGVDEAGNSIENDITHMMLEIFIEDPVPDPKLLVRVNKNTSEVIWKKCIQSILTGCGSPLLLNEGSIMKGMKAFGYEEKDVWNFGTSACWEPLVIGKSFDQNNRIKNIAILKTLEKPLQQQDWKSYAEFEQAVLQSVKQLIGSWPLDVRFDKSPLMTLLFDDCIVRGKDFCDGGAKYNYHGLLVVGLPNLVNALLNIKSYVFEEKLFTIADVTTALLSNYGGHTDMQQLFNTNKKKFGLAEKEIIDLTNRITDAINDTVKDLKILGQPAKVGFSSPGYVGLAQGFPASPDGRKFGEPFAVHISPISSDVDINQIFRFASKLDYSGTRINGNVVDFIVPSSYAKEPEKLVNIIRTGMESGIYEMQMNVLDRNILIDAKAHPEKYPNLIVRVWGFSAYFNDLPEAYKDNLIARAGKYGAC